MASPVYRLLDTRHGAVVAERVARADSAWQRLLGLAGRRSIAQGTGLWLCPCNGIHTFGMRFSLDILVLDRDGAVVAAWQGVPPCRLRWPVRHGHSTVELGTGTIALSGVRVGDRLLWEPAVETGTARRR